jgi:hypothetical protein
VIPTHASQPRALSQAPEACQHHHGMHPDGQDGKRRRRTHSCRQQCSALASSLTASSCIACCCSAHASLSQLLCCCLTTAAAVAVAAAAPQPYCCWGRCRNSIQRGLQFESQLNNHQAVAAGSGYSRMLCALHLEFMQLLSAGKLLTTPRLILSGFLSAKKFSVTPRMGSLGACTHTTAMGTACRGA